jgi:hypothetical protein
MTEQVRITLRSRGRKQINPLTAVAVCHGYAVIGYPARDQANNNFCSVSLYADVNVGGGIASPGHA